MFLDEEREIEQIQQWIDSEINSAPPSSRTQTILHIRKFLDLPVIDEYLTADDIFYTFKYEHYREQELTKLPNKTELKYLLEGGDRTILESCNKNRMLLMQHEQIAWKDEKLAEQKEETKCIKAELNAKINDGQLEMEERLDDMYHVIRDLNQQIKELKG